MVYFFYFNKIILLNLIINIITMNSVNNNLVTIDNEYIPISNIKDIYK